MIVKNMSDMFSLDCNCQFLVSLIPSKLTRKEKTGWSYFPVPVTEMQFFFCPQSVLKLRRMERAMSSIERLLSPSWRTMFSLWPTLRPLPVG